MSNRSRVPLVAGMLAAMTAAAVLRWVIGHPLTVHTQAMAPTVQQGETVWVAQRSARLGDVVQVDLGGGYGLYRVVATGGQRVDIENRALFVDGVRTDASQASTVRLMGQACEAVDVPVVRANLEGHDFGFVPGGEDVSVTVPPSMVYLLGDNRGAAGDSRTWGAVPETALEGVATRVLWSWAPCISRVRWRRIWNSIE